MSRTSKKLSASQLRKFRSDVAKLKAKGLVSKRIDARSQKPTRYMREQVKRFDDVLSGKAKVVKTPRRKDARSFSGKYETKFDRVVIPAKQKATARYNKKKKQIDVSTTENGVKIRKTITGKAYDSVKDFPKGKNIAYRITFGGGQAFTFTDINDLAEFMMPYETKSRNPFKQWERYVEFVKI